MPALSLIIAPDPIFKMKSAPVEVVDDQVRIIMDNLLATIHYANGVGIAAPMVGILKQIIVIDLQDDNSSPLYMANPYIIEKSAELQSFTEGSLCFPGIKAVITRPKNISVKFLDYNGKQTTLEATDLLSTCIQHEIDYLHAITFLEHLPKVKKDILLRKMQKYKKFAHNHHHVHDESCNH
jgi:peptide deformylase